MPVAAIDLIRARDKAMKLARRCLYIYTYISKAFVSAACRYVWPFSSVSVRLSRDVLRSLCVVMMIFTSYRG